MTRRALPVGMLALSACQLIAGYEGFQAGAAGAGAGAAAAGAAGSAGPAACTGGSLPSGTRGALMIRIADRNLGCFWIDETEVTRAHYADFLATFARTSAEALVNVIPCKGSNPDFEPDSVPLTPPNRPIAGVDWCDAAAYCAWAGKSLCAKTGAGSASDSRLWLACTDGANASYNYLKMSETAGNPCNGGAASTESSDVKAFSGCATPRGVYDLVGNVAEWADECLGATHQASCVARGGSYASTGTAWGCDAALELPRDYRSAQIGFRCCREDR